MAKIYISYINPIRFRREDEVIDNNTIFPQIDLMTQRIAYQKGISPVNFYPDWKAGETMIIQIQTDSPAWDATIMTLTTPTSTVRLTPTNVTPSGWNGNAILNYSYYFSGSTIGENYFRVFNVGPGVESDYISDIFVVRSNDSDLVKINYSDSQNRYGGVHYNGGVQIWNPVAYYTGQIIPFQPEDDQSVYDDQLGNTVILQSTPKRMAKLNIVDIHNTYIDTIKQQSIGGTYKVNDVKYAASNFEVSQIDPKSSIVNISMDLTLQDNDYFFK